MLYIILCGFDLSLCFFVLYIKNTWLFKWVWVPVCHKALVEVRGQSWVTVLIIHLVSLVPFCWAHQGEETTTFCGFSSLQRSSLRSAAITNASGTDPQVHETNSLPTGPSPQPCGTLCFSQHI